MADFTPTSRYTPTPHAMRWLDNGDILLTVAIRRGGDDGDVVGHRSVTLTAAGRVVKTNGADVAAVPGGFSAWITAGTPRLTTLIQFLAAGGHLDP